MSKRLQVCVVAVIVLAFFGCLVASIAPTDVLSRSTLARHFVSMAAIVLPIEGYGRHSLWPEIAMLYYSIVWMAFPFALVGTWEVFKMRDGKGDGILFRPQEKLGIVPRVVLVVLAPLWLFLAYVGFRYWGGNSRLFSFATSFWQMSLLGVLAPLLTALGLAMGVGSLVKAVRGRFV